jgi:hypothetical protein
VEHIGIQGSELFPIVFNFCVADVLLCCFMQFATEQSQIMRNCFWIIILMEKGILLLYYKNEFNCLKMIYLLYS